MNESTVYAVLGTAVLTTAILTFINFASIETIREMVKEIRDTQRRKQ